jgi:CRP/FNR family transcriptional regulator, cyclic AMP receptor protein
VSSDNQKIEEASLLTHSSRVSGWDRIKVLAQSAVSTHFEKDQVIFKAGEPADGFYLVRDHGPITTDVVSAGEPLGWSWLFPPYLWHFDARATEPTTAVCFSGRLLRQHRDEDPALSHELFKRACEVMVRRLQAARSKLLAGRKPHESAK